MRVVRGAPCLAPDDAFFAVGYNASITLRSIFRKTDNPERLLIGILIGDCQAAVPTNFNKEPGKLVLIATKVAGGPLDRDSLCTSNRSFLTAAACA